MGVYAEKEHKEGGAGERPHTQSSHPPSRTGDSYPRSGLESLYQVKDELTGCRGLSLSSGVWKGHLHSKYSKPLSCLLLFVLDPH